MKARISAIVLLLLLFALSLSVGAINSSAAQLLDPVSNTVVENPSPKRYVRVTYIGSKDSRRRASGHGTASWYRSDGFLAMRYTGNFTKGQMHKTGTIVSYESCIAFRGTFDRGDPIDGLVGYICEKIDSLLVEMPADTIPDDVGMLRLPELTEIEIQYPRAADLLGAAGFVRLRALVDTSGAVQQVRVEHSSHACFALRAANNVFSAHFTPTKWGGRAHPVWVHIPIRFRQ